MSCKILKLIVNSNKKGMKKPEIDMFELLFGIKSVLLVLDSEWVQKKKPGIFYQAIF